MVTKDTENFGTFKDMQTAILSGEIIEFKRGLWQESEVYRFITDYLSNENHNGVVISGNDPWLISVIPR